MKKNIITSAATIITSAMLAITAMPIASFAAGNITLEQAKQIALTNAGLNANQVTFVKEGMEMDDGRTKYEVEFYAGNMEYDYDIDALTGAIISFDQDCEVNYMATAPAAVPVTPKATAPAAVPVTPKAAAPQAAAPAAPQAPAATTGAVTKDQALQIALNHAGLTKNDIMFSNVRKDYDDGMEIWEVEFHQGFYEYNYDIAVANGQIVDFDIDD
ncbi:PepSY domain-containing protein [Butyrivibrio sp. XPD2006]|uniref:PepSY domain-containing protein n=1 Tax=Butyrivibrio sp. XPD2006 TaxID=1280668 RepID=UPI0003B32CCB|nr:PepSY domain-containing protein [Butyrivibrio sp. XPD2006]